MNVYFHNWPQASSARCTLFINYVDGTSRAIRDVYYFAFVKDELHVYTWPQKDENVYEIKKPIQFINISLADPMSGGPDA